MVTAYTPFRVLMFQLLTCDGTKYDPRFTNIQAVQSHHTFLPTQQCYFSAPILGSNYATLLHMMAIASQP